MELSYGILQYDLISSESEIGESISYVYEDISYHHAHEFGLNVHYGLGRFQIFTGAILHRYMPLDVLEDQLAFLNRVELFNNINDPQYLFRMKLGLVMCI